MARIDYVKVKIYVRPSEAGLLAVAARYQLKHYVHLMTHVKILVRRILQVVALQLINSVVIRTYVYSQVLGPIQDVVVI